MRLGPGQADFSAELYRQSHSADKALTIGIESIRRDNLEVSSS